MKRQATLAIACLYLNLSHLLKGGPSEASEYMPVLLVWQYFFQSKTALKPEQITALFSLLLADCAASLNPL